MDEASTSRSGPQALRFEITRCVLVPAHEDVAVLELEGTFVARARRAIGRPRLVVTTAEGALEAKALHADTAHAGPEPDPWRASFALPRALADAADAQYALAVGRSVTLELAAPINGPSSNPNADVEGETWGSMVVDLSEARRELSEAQNDLARAQEEIARLQAQVEEHTEAEPPKREPVLWLDEVEAETGAAPNGDAPHDEDDLEDFDDDEDEIEGDALPVLSDRRLSHQHRPPTMEHDAVYEATLKRMQTERRARLRRRRILGRLLALVVFLLAAAAIYIVVEGVVGLDLIGLF
ncbi:MAG: hypothetical protein JHC95_08830 [Solirubrobacteraceae bacterium]|nr:hypothetical protein [Solirubrobacteraceae bacterium]